MRLESRHIESVIHHWILLEEMKQRKEQLQARAVALSINAHETHDDYVRVPEHCIEVRRKT